MLKSPENEEKEDESMPHIMFVCHGRIYRA